MGGDSIVSGIELTTASTLRKVGTLIVVAVVFGLINAFLKPIIKTFGCAFYILTLGLFAFVVNGLLLWLASWAADKMNLPFHVSGFGSAFWGAIVVGVVSCAQPLRPRRQGLRLRPGPGGPCC